MFDSIMQTFGDGRLTWDDVYEFLWIMAIPAGALYITLKVARADHERFDRGGQDRWWSIYRRR